jgi:hypothetical protein
MSVPVGPKRGDPSVRMPMAVERLVESAVAVLLRRYPRSLMIF